MLKRGIALAAALIFACTALVSCAKKEMENVPAQTADTSTHPLLYTKNDSLLLLRNGESEPITVFEGKTDKNVSVSDDASTVFFREKSGGLYMLDVKSGICDKISDKTDDAAGLRSGKYVYYISENNLYYASAEDKKSKLLAENVNAFKFDKNEAYVLYEMQDSAGMAKIGEDGAKLDGINVLDHILTDSDNCVISSDMYYVDIENGELKKISEDGKVETLSSGGVVNAMLFGGALYVFKQASEADENGSFLMNLYTLKDGAEEMVGAGIVGTECSNKIYSSKSRLLFVLQNAVSGSYEYYSLSSGGVFAPLCESSGNVVNMFTSSAGDELYINFSDDSLKMFKIASDGYIDKESGVNVDTNVKFASISDDGVCQIYSKNGFDIYEDGKLCKVYESQQSYAQVTKTDNALYVSDKFGNGGLYKYADKQLTCLFEHVSDHRVRTDKSVYFVNCERDESGALVNRLYKYTDGGDATLIDEGIDSLIY